MKYIITENQLNRAALRFLNSEYGDLEVYKTKKYPKHTFFMKDGEIIFDYNGDGQMIISYDHIWSFLYNFFGLEKEEIKDLIKQWVEKNYNISVKRIYPQKIDDTHWWVDVID
jgi:hypothetical protein